LRSVIRKLKRLVPAGTPWRSKAGEIEAHAGMPDQEKRTDRALADVGTTAAAPIASAVTAAKDGVLNLGSN